MISRRTFCQYSASALLAMRASSTWAETATSPQVKLRSGTLVGEKVPGVRVFRGVPFAQPPVGPLRFLPPNPVQPWTGVRDATRFASAPIQTDNVEQSEDCLYLNLWAPDHGGPYPVFVWIYGGGFTVGRSSDPVFHGEDFARKGIVCITIAYRLGALGLVDMEPALGPKYAGSANNALKDIVAALSWVKENISAFGGDPGRVTVGGQSAGAKLIDLLMGVPSAQPLFHQMISESGGADRIWPREQALHIGQAFASTWTQQTSSEPAGILRAAPADLLRVQREILNTWPVRFPIRSEIDGDFIKQSPLATIRGGSTRGKRLLIGTNREESAAGLGPHPTGPVTSKDLGNMSPAQFSPIDLSYAAAFPAMSPEMRRIRSITAEEYWVPSMRVAEAHITGGGEAFVYRFDLGGEGKLKNLSVHTHELRFVWNCLSKEVDSVPAHELAVSVHEAWASFIRGEAPSSHGLPVWPPYTFKDPETMLFDAVSRVERGPQAVELALWQGVLTE